ncbi:MAG TPA: SpoIIE family protein phosphatase [Terriglobales bacterium]|nr:SpoIIE family protein phosphatase [Terriglobales bacterium]
MNAVAVHEMQPVTRAVSRVLIADDQTAILEALQMLLGGSGFSTEAVTHPSRVLQALQTAEFDAVIMDLNYTRDTTAGGEGLDLLSQIRSLDRLLPVMVMTAWSSVDLAVEAMRRGATDFIQKPWENHELLEKLQRQVSLCRAERQVQRQRAEELQDAREIQQNLLPRELPAIAGFDLAAMTRPLRFVGGDYYNVVQIDSRRTALCIADVAGKGLPAALLMSSLQAALTPLVRQKLEPQELCNRLNRILCEVTPTGKFVSFFYGVLDNIDRRLTYCNAGHNPPLLVRADGQAEELEAAGAVLGQFPYWRYEQSGVQMNHGDTLAMFTDGLVEVCDGKEEPFGEMKIIHIARENLNSSARQTIGALLAAASQHCGEQFQDDSSLIVLKAVATGAGVEPGQKRPLRMRPDCVPRTLHKTK